MIITMDALSMKFQQQFQQKRIPSQGSPNEDLNRKILMQQDLASMIITMDPLSTKFQQRFVLKCTAWGALFNR